MKNYTHTLVASFIGYITQAIINNFIPLLFLTFQSNYAIPLNKITLLVTINFGIQLLVDLLAAHYVDKIGYRTAIVGAHVFAAAGLAGLGIFPEIFAEPYIGILCAIVLYAIGGGIIEVLVSPIVEACPTNKKSAAMSLLHSFYCWGHMLVVIVSTLFFIGFGIENWRILAFVWAIIPLFNAIYFSQVPINTLHEEGESFSIKQLFSGKIFWIFVILMVCAGASEQAMSQWASAFAEVGLQVSKTVGDLAGPCLFAALMGISRVFYSRFSERMDLEHFMLGSGILCIFSYLLAVFSTHPLLGLIGCGLCGLSVGILWPGTFSLASEKCPRGGTAMFAFFALAGDFGCSAGPTVVGMVSNAMNGKLKAGLLAAIIFPILLIIGLILCKRVTDRGEV
ncbi:MFS transporter [Sporanaerobium hydrogeniformans]|uniref:MFS transporter n=1 Tax=Sporanaerobium hydrogeniformans TaxID=3072179 RepID=A0AC61DC59_9FIRM|nr:MFS transporter [Sporanaerobium hydrogeniformans]PHV70251.1 MFS transporter [Sporanaerobium hydrogeniformans]